MTAVPKTSAVVSPFQTGASARSCALQVCAHSLFPDVQPYSTPSRFSRKTVTDPIGSFAAMRELARPKGVCKRQALEPSTGAMQHGRRERCENSADGRCDEPCATER